jgi:hypothetical protein
LKISIALCGALRLNSSVDPQSMAIILRMAERILGVLIDEVLICRFD